MSMCRLTALRQITPFSTEVKGGTVACLHVLSLINCSVTVDLVDLDLVLLQLHELNVDQVRRRLAVQTLELLESLLQAPTKAPLFQSVFDFYL